MKLTFTIILICFTVVIHAQNVGIGNTSPDPHAILDITATDRGILIPRMDSVHRKSIPNTAGLLVYDSSTKSFWFNDGASWQNIGTSSSSWSLTGNQDIDTAKTFLGTIDNLPILFKVNDQFAGKIFEGTVSLGEGAFSLEPSGEDLETVAIGINALHNNVTDWNIAPNSGSYNTAVGGHALFSNTNGYNNTSVGTQCMVNNSTGLNNTGEGAFAMHENTTGNLNSAFGSHALHGNVSGSFNIAVGNYAASASNSDGNTAIGYSALLAFSPGDYVTAIGYQASISTNNLTNATAIGANAIVDASNKIRLGDANITVVESSGTFHTVSDGRFKYNVQHNVKGLDFIMKLRPVTYQLDTKKQEDFTKGLIRSDQLNSHIIPAALNESNAVKRTGFIAQEVATAALQTGFDFDGVKIPANDNQYYSLSYASFVVPLVKAIQEQQQTIDALKKQNALILKRLKRLENKK